MNQNQVNLEPEEPLLPSPSSEMLAYMEKLYPLIFAFKHIFSSAYLPQDSILYSMAK